MSIESSDGERCAVAGRGDMARNIKHSGALPPLTALRAFDAVGTMGGVRAAAEALNVGPTVVSRHIDNLEKRLGVALVRAKGRSIVLTEAGAKFNAQITTAFAIIADATDEVTKPARAPLRIWCTPGLAVMRLLPRLPELEARLGKFAIHLRPTLARPDLKHGEADAEIFYRADDEGEAPREGLVELELARPRVMPVACPTLVDGRATPLRDLALLSDLPWIEELSSDEWRSWVEKVGLPIDAHAQERLVGARLWHAHVAIGAAQLGQGVALANELLVENDLAEGRLVEIGRTDVRLGAYMLALRAETREAPEMRELVAWLGALMTSPRSPSASDDPLSKRRQSGAN
jgi:DNA-binding transcriptional LysR family regulator